MSAAVEASMDQDAARKRCTELGLVFWFVDKRSGKKRFLKAETMRTRIAAVEAAAARGQPAREAGPAWWFDRAAASAAEDAGGTHEDAAEEPGEGERRAAAFLAAPVAAAPASNPGRALEDAIRAIAGGAVDEAKVRAIVAGELAGVVKAIEGIAPSRFEVSVNGAVKAPTIDGIPPAWFKTMLDLATCHPPKHIFLKGPAGAGKTYSAQLLAEALAKVTGKPTKLALVSCNPGMSPAALEGRLLPIETGGKMTYIPAEAVEAYEEDTGGYGILLLDDVDRADGAILSVLHMMLANCHFSIPARVGKPVALRQPRFLCVATANTFGHGGNRVYAHAGQLDGAFLDRFRSGMVEVDYDAAFETQRIRPDVLAWGLSVRKQIDDHGLRRIMSSRALIDFSDLAAQKGWKRKEWERAYFADWSADDRALIKTKGADAEGEQA